MIINHTHKFIFIHIPKTAGTSVTRSLATLTRYCDQEIGASALGEAAQMYFFRRFGLRKHSRADELMNVMGRETYMEYFRFAFVRNPFSRLASAYYFLKAWQGIPENFGRLLDQCPDLESFLDSDLWTSGNASRGPDAIFQPQARWLFSQGSNPELLVNFVGRTESITKDMNQILEQIGAGAVAEVERVNVSPKYQLPRQWKPTTVDRILHEYKRDFKAFGYSEDPPVAGNGCED